LSPFVKNIVIISTTYFLRYFSMNHNIIASLILGAALIVTGVISTGQDRVSPVWQAAFGTIQVSSEGTAKSVPDTTIINAWAQIIAAETQELAYTQMNQTVNAIKDILKKAGIEESKIQTQNLSVNQSFDYIDGKQTPNGFNAYQTLTIRIENKEEEIANSILDAVSKVPNIQMNGVDFETLATDGVYSEARKEAITKAKAKAQEIADASGVKLGKILSISESTSQYNGPIYPMAKAESMDSVWGGASISSGELEYSVSVDISYEIK